VGGVNGRCSLPHSLLTTEVPTKPPIAPRTPQQKFSMLWVCVHCVYVQNSLLCVYVCGWVKCRAQIPCMGHHTMVNTSRHVTSLDDHAL